MTTPAASSTTTTGTTSTTTTGTAILATVADGCQSYASNFSCSRVKNSSTFTGASTITVTTKASDYCGNGICSFSMGWNVYQVGATSPIAGCGGGSGVFTCIGLTAGSSYYIHAWFSFTVTNGGRGCALTGCGAGYSVTAQQATSASSGPATLGTVLGILMGILSVTVTGRNGANRANGSTVVSGRGCVIEHSPVRLRAGEKAGLGWDSKPRILVRGVGVLPYMLGGDSKRRMEKTPRPVFMAKQV